jgi:tRNA pseudouridine38-40 synthase
MPTRATRATRPAARGDRRPPGPRSTYRLDVEYDGTRYRGWQIQQNARSVAGELTLALERAGARLGELAGSGRTDAGVHALGQVAHLRLAEAVDADALRRALNDILPPDIHVRGLVRADPAFHARHDAQHRTYLYQIARRRTAFAKRFVWWIRDALDAGAMARAAEPLVGRHDFRRFCEQPAAQPSTIVVVEEARVVEAGELILVRLTASHFLWKMVRRLVGALARVGTGQLEPDALRRMLAEPDAPGEATAAWTAPPSGLFLERVAYPGEPPLGELRPAFPLGGEPPPERRFVGRARTGAAPSPFRGPGVPRRSVRGR